MPKKVNRQPTRSKSRPNRPATPRPATRVVGSEDEALVANGALSGASTVPAPTRSVAVPVRPNTSSARPTAAAPRRSPTAARKTATTVINYGYLRRDLIALAILAPSMIVLVIIAFFIWH